MTGVVALVFPTQALGSSSTLEVLDGVVAVSHEGNRLAGGQDGDLLQEGDVIWTGEGSHAVLTLQASSAGDLLMTMQQTIGRSWHVVSRR